MAIDREEYRRIAREELAAERREREREEREAKRDQELADLRKRLDERDARGDHEPEPDDDADHEPEV